MADGPDLRAELRHETGPIVIHGITVLILEGFVLLIGVGLLVLKYFFPSHKAQLEFLEAADIWLALALVCLFGAYTLIVLVIRLTKGVLREWNRV